MPGFLYFTPGVTKAENPSKLGLGYALGEGKEHIANDVFFSFADYSANGVLWAAKTNVAPHELKFLPNEQVWRRIPNSDRWIGHYREGQPTPADLSRRKMIDGYVATFDDGNVWVCPCARRVSDSGDKITGYLALPARYSLDDSGNWKGGGVKKRYLSLWDLAVAYFDAWSNAYDANDITFDFPSKPRLAVLALQANYLVSDVELDMLGVFDEDAMACILSALIDEPAYEEIVKKKLAKSGGEDLNGSTGMSAESEE